MAKPEPTFTLKTPRFKRVGKGQYKVYGPLGHLYIERYDYDDTNSDWYWGGDNEPFNIETRECKSLAAGKKAAINYYNKIVRKNLTKVTPCP